jgi:hypothetical protein
MDAMDDRSQKLFRKLDKGMGTALAVFVAQRSARWCSRKGSPE